MRWSLTLWSRHPLILSIMLVTDAEGCPMAWTAARSRRSRRRPEVEVELGSEVGHDRGFIVLET